MFNTPFDFSLRDGCPVVPEAPLVRVTLNGVRTVNIGVRGLPTHSGGCQRVSRIWLFELWTAVLRDTLRRLASAEAHISLRRRESEARGCCSSENRTCCIFRVEAVEGPGSTDAAEDF